VTDPVIPPPHDVGETAHQHLVALPTDDAGSAQRRQLLPVPLSGSLKTTWSAPQTVAAAAWCGWRASTVTGQWGKRPRNAARDANPMMPATDDQDRFAVDGMARIRPWHAIDTGS